MTSDLLRRILFPFHTEQRHARLLYLDLVLPDLYFPCRFGVQAESVTDIRQLAMGVRRRLGSGIGYRRRSGLAHLRGSLAVNNRTQHAVRHVMLLQADQSVRRGDEVRP